MRPLLLGMNNPLSDDPEFDLYPYPEGSAGWRLWKLLPEGTTRGQYLDAFERRNLLRARAWDQAKAREAARALLPELDGRLVVVLGTQVRAAMGLPGMLPLEMARTTVLLSPPCGGQKSVTFTWVPFPHPSGRNLWFNKPDNLISARAMLESVILQCAEPDVRRRVHG